MKNQYDIWRNRSMTSQILIISWILEGVGVKTLDAIILFIDSSKAFDSMHKGNIKQILHANGLSKEIVAAIFMLYRNMEVKVRSQDGDTDYFDMVAGVQPGVILASYIFSSA